MSDSESNNGTIKSNNIRKKVSICNVWLRKGYCPRGLACFNAHGTDELQDGESDVKKSQDICKYWSSSGWCRNGDKCRFMHPMNEKGNNDENERNLEDNFSDNNNYNASNSSSANIRDGSSVKPGKRLQKNFCSLASLPTARNGGGTSNQTRGETSNQKIDKDQKIDSKNFKINNDNSLNNNCFLQSSRLKNAKDIPPPLMSENNSGSFGGFGHNRRNGGRYFGGSSSYAAGSGFGVEHGGGWAGHGSKTRNKRMEQEKLAEQALKEFDNEDDWSFSSLDKRLNKIEEKFGNNNKNQDDEGENGSLINLMPRDW